MNVLNSLVNHVRYASSSVLLVGALFAAVTGVAVGASTLHPVTSASAATCNVANNILPCGASSPADFAGQYRTNHSGDLPAIYNYYNLSPQDIDRFAKTAQIGVAHKDGTITIGSKVVATNATSLGREPKAHSQTLTIGGKTYYSDRNQDVFLSDTIPAMILMNGDQFEFAALTACGNPLKGTPTGQPPKYSCDLLKPHQIDRTTFSYTTDVTALHGAQVAKLVYDFGDGKSQTVSSAAQTVTHSYAKEGTYTTKVTVYVAVNGETKVVTDTHCAKSVTVNPVPVTPAFACDVLQPTTINKDLRQYRFTAKTSQSGGATLKDASFDFGDKQSISGVKPTDDSTVSTEHTFAQTGTYIIVATVSFSVAGGVKSATCQTTISPEQQPPAECKPGIPVGDSRCTETPGNLPNTSGLDIASGAVGTTSVFTAGSYFLRSRRNIVKALFRK